MAYNPRTYCKELNLLIIVVECGPIKLTTVKRWQINIFLSVSVGYCAKFLHTYLIWLDQNFMFYVSSTIMDLKPCVRIPFYLPCACLSSKKINIITIITVLFDTQYFANSRTSHTSLF